MLNIVFVGVLIWKAILYFVYLKEFAKLKEWRFSRSVCRNGSRYFDYGSIEWICWPKDTCSIMPRYSYGERLMDDTISPANAIPCEDVCKMSII